jgi:hypothetical protein
MSRAKTPERRANVPRGNDRTELGRRNRVGDRIHRSVNGPVWQVTAIAALPGDCKFRAVSGFTNLPGAWSGADSSSSGSAKPFSRITLGWAAFTDT